MVFMKTTLLLSERVYQKLVKESIKRYGSAKKLSQTANDMLECQLEAPKSMFGSLKPFSLKGLREKHDRIT